jgi:hypothetical protein
MPDNPKEMHVRDARPHEMRQAGLPLGAKVKFAQVWGIDEPGQRYSQGKARSIASDLKKGISGIQVSIIDAPVLH